MLNALRHSQFCQHPPGQVTFPISLQEHKRCSQPLVNIKPDMEVILQRDEDKPKRILPPSPPPQGPLDKLKRLLDMGKLIELVESLKLKREFIQFLNDQLIEYYGKESHKRSFVVLPIKSEGLETTAELDDSFEQAIYRLHQLYCRETRADALFEICFATFQKRRVMFIMENIDNRFAFKDVLSRLIYFDKDPVIAANAYREMRLFSFIHELIYNIKYDLRYKKFTRKSFEKKLNLIYELPLGEFQYEKFHIPTCSPFLFNRDGLVQYFCHHIDKEVDSMLSIMKNLQKDLNACELSEYERCVGRVVHIVIEEVKSISSSSSSSSSSPLPLCFDAKIPKEQGYDLCGPKYNLTHEDQNEIRDGFFKFYRRFTANSLSSSDLKTYFDIDFKTDFQNSDISSISSDSNWDSHSDSDDDTDNDSV